MKLKGSTQDRAKMRIKGICLALGTVSFVCVASAIATSENHKTVSVVRLKNDVSANALITDDMIEEYDMYYKEFANAGVQKLSDGSSRQAIVTWDKKDSVVGKRYASYFLRGGTNLYWDETVKEQSKKNSYLYNMDGELLNIQMDTEDFGDMVVPGDVLNIRVSYEDTLYDLPSEEAYKNGVSAGSKVEPVKTTVTEKLFNSVSVLDMLNSKGESIFDIYYSYISKSKAEQKKLLQDSSFLSSVKPDKILLEVTAEEADRFLEISSKSPKYLMTLLPRQGSSAILDSLNDIQKAVNSSKEGNK